MAKLVRASWTRRRTIVLLGLASILGVTLVLFPRQRLAMALTIATGFRRGSLQERIDGLEAKAIRGAPFSEDDKEFLEDFYRTLATGAKVTILVHRPGS